MANLPPSPFSSVDTGVSAETLVVASVSQAPAAAASSHLSDSGTADLRPDEAAVPDPQMPSAGAAADSPVSPGVLLGSLPANGESEPSVMPAWLSGENHIREIFAGARKLEPVEMWFENTAYPREDELLYEVLSAMDKPETPDLREIPDEVSFMIELGPPPLFLRASGF